MKLTVVATIMGAALIAPQLSFKEPSAPPVALVANSVPTLQSQWENYEARMDQVSEELDGIVNDLERMHPESLLQLQPVLAELLIRHDELTQVLELGGEGIKDGSIRDAGEIKQLSETVDPEISAFEDAVFHLRSALDQQLQLRAEI